MSSSAAKQEKRKQKKKKRDEDSDDEENAVSLEELQGISPLMEMGNWLFVLELDDDACEAGEKDRVRDLVLKEIEAKAMAPFYRIVCERLGWVVDEALLARMEKQNEEEVASLLAAIETAREQAGEVEVRDGMYAHAQYLARIGSKQEAIEALEATQAKTAGGGNKIDIEFDLVRLALLHQDVELLRARLEKIKVILETGGDWERRNRLKIYEATYCIMSRDLKRAATLLLDSVQTFTSYELFNFETFVLYTALTGAVALDRATLREKIVDSPEILSVQNKIPHLGDFLQSLHACRYDQFFRTLVPLADVLRRDRFLSAHYNYYLREIRIVAYSQFLRSYRSVKISNMATAFGVSPAFIDRELARFIASGRLNAKIDKVNGVVETNRPDSRNAQYQAVIRQGDMLLNRIQKLTKVISS